MLGTLCVPHSLTRQRGSCCSSSQSVLLYLAGARGLLLLALAFVVSGIASFVLLSRQRDIMSGALLARLQEQA